MNRGQDFRATPVLPPSGPSHPVVLFDGVCNFCNASVNFIINRDPHARIRFAALQSEAGRAVLRRAGLPEDFEASLVLVHGGRAEFASSGALAIAGYLKRPWSWLRFLRVVPRFARDGVYRVLADHRYRWFGRRDACRVPKPGERERFLS